MKCYRTVKPEYIEILKNFKNFISENNIGELVPKQWEVTYVNHILKGALWNTPENWTSIFKSLPGLAEVPEGLQFEGFGGHWHFQIPPQRGRLHVSLQHTLVGKEKEEKTEALVMRLTARGPVEENKDPIDGLDLGHDILVRSFYELTSERAHEYWNRENNDANG